RELSVPALLRSVSLARVGSLRTPGRRLRLGDDPLAEGAMMQALVSSFILHPSSLFRSWFANPRALFLAVLVPVLGAIALLAWRRRRRALALLGSTPALIALVSVGSRWRVLRGLCLTVGLLCLIAGSADPRWGRDWEKSTAPGRDVVVVLDVSRSMFAEVPSRFDRARAALTDLSATVQQRG